MSIIARLRKQKKTKGVFAIICGLRLAGKSTLSGTLPGKTILMQAALRETGSSSAEALAKKHGNELVIVEFATLEDLNELLIEAANSDFDNIYVDGISAITEMRFSQPEIYREALSKNPWGAYAKIKKTMEDFIMLGKSITEQSHKNVFFTLAMNISNDGEGQPQLKADLKGSATLSVIKGLAPTVLVVASRTDETGVHVRELLTRNQGIYQARIDTLLDEQNPGVLPADLSLILNLIQGV